MSTPNDQNDTFWDCPVCGYSHKKPTLACPSCGAHLLLLNKIKLESEKLQEGSSGEALYRPLPKQDKIDP